MSDGTLHEFTSCCICGCTFGVLRTFLNARRNNHREFFCPNGYSLTFKGPTPAERPKEELEDVKRQLNRTKYLLDGVVHGKCPHCMKTVKDLSAHISRKHKELL